MAGSLIADPWGGIFIGAFISVILFGVIMAQAFTYYQTYEQDPLWQKCFVGVLVALDTLSTILVITWMYDLFVNGWGDITYYLSSSWLLAMDPIVAGLVAFMVQIFFAWRLHVIARQMWLTITIVVLSVITLGGALGVAISTLIVHEFVHFGEAKVKDVVYFWLVPTAVCDILICGALTYHLRRRKGTYKATGKLLDRIIRLSVQNGLLTSMLATATLIAYLYSAMPYQIGPSFSLPKLYCNAVLSSLNARQGLSGLASATVEMSGRSTTAAELSNFDPKPSGQPQRPEVFVQIDHETADSESQFEGK
ncbi:hypothetical protein FIBSPDRAFT_805176 [Athelia psychrophila]|uniref:DUF6534 domain-containing protein n=1 Tax=Athelia psychrophila TaxID=1759441 RepID=A0A167WIB8_9AGAM|nr:hypothetical protein FIBSPDRAFT_805176 [Fibularhizoctonia sp. CBS 109695]